jgi:hypothetical protein
MLAWRDLHSSSVICLANREWKQTESVSAQNDVSRCEMI